MATAKETGLNTRLFLPFSTFVNFGTRRSNQIINPKEAMKKFIPQFQQVPRSVMEMMAQGPTRNASLIERMVHRAFSYLNKGEKKEPKKYPTMVISSAEDIKAHNEAVVERNKVKAEAKAERRKQREAQRQTQPQAA